MASDTGRRWQQIKLTAGIESDFAEFYEKSGQRYKTGAFEQLILDGCEAGYDKKADDYLNAYNAPLTPKRRTQISVTDEIHRRVEKGFGRLTVVVEARYFLAICYGLRVNLGRSPNI